MVRNKNLEEYIEQHCSTESPLLAQINRQTHTQLINPRMLSGHVQGRFLAMISNMVKPSRILEIGTFSGYSALCLAEGLQPNGQLHTIEVDDELENVIINNFNKYKNCDALKLHIGNAIEILKQFTEPFDLIFIDGEKKEYPTYFKMCVPLLKKGGYLLADNVLWNGKVVDPSQQNNIATAAVVEYNNLVKNNALFECLILDIRDGINIARKIND